MANLTGIFSFPAGALNRELRDIPLATRTAIRDKLESIGFEFTWATLDNTVRDILEYVGHSIQLAEWADVQISSANFNTNKIVGDIPQEKRQLVNRHLQDLGIDTSWITLSTTIRDVVRHVQTTDGVNPRLFGVRKQLRWFYYDEDTE
jgi:hypothetical protein